MPAPLDALLLVRRLDKSTGRMVAFKIIDLEEVEDDIDSIHKEITMLAGCHCSNITEYYASVLKPGATELVIVMELMACSVADLLGLGPLDEASIALVLHEVLCALAYLHGEHRIHRDVKAANILLGEQGDVKISDFGVSGQLSGTLGFRRRTFVGTPFWMAPEVIQSSDEGYSERADIWSLGITAIEMATGSPPHANLHPMRVLFLIPKDPPPQLHGHFSPDFKDFVSRCLQKDPSQRPSAMELLQHPFVARSQSEEGGQAQGGGGVREVLASMAMQMAAHRKPIMSRKSMHEDFSTGTLPCWDFGTKRMGRMTVRLGDTARSSLQAAATADRLGTGTLPAAALAAFKGTMRAGTVRAAVGQAFAHMTAPPPAADTQAAPPLDPPATATPPVTPTPQGAHAARLHDNGTGEEGDTGTNAMSANGQQPIPPQPPTLEAGSGAVAEPQAPQAAEGSGGLQDGQQAKGQGESRGEEAAGAGWVGPTGQLQGQQGWAGTLGRPASPPQQPASDRLAAAAQQQQPAAQRAQPGLHRATVSSTGGEAPDEPYATVKVRSLDKSGTLPSRTSWQRTLGPGSAPGPKALPPPAPHPGFPLSGRSSASGTGTVRSRGNTLQVNVAHPTARPQPGGPGAWPLPDPPAGVGAGESKAVLLNVLLPSLALAVQGLEGAAAPPQVAQAAQAATAVVQQQLRHLEHVVGGSAGGGVQLPGLSAHLLHYALVHLTASTDPALAPPRAAACALLASSPASMSAAGHGHRNLTHSQPSAMEQPDPDSLSSQQQAPPDASATACKVQAGWAASHPTSNGGAGSWGYAQQGQGQGQASGQGFLPQRSVPHLGALGEFLLGRWQQEVAHEHALLARSQPLPR
ncbi:hypothetical protein QJQ45_004596 [Haematococcus lacustris]|nr:hypothetical protein QJQ45_004596 [Haematococcus lacustris]